MHVFWRGSKAKALPYADTVFYEKRDRKFLHLYCQRQPGLIRKDFKAILE
ncbi:MAG: hypothetical protein JETT_3782 [Candidatus Jettenia ecosi]|uniref:Uncharacterized protein n=1 Tax=Candidatus Jettenia ecosi TaxID=2494326 RepID=A0A533Q5X5_9BACT|nr:MAG: hypothetical protein JETT_3782 [Candidatus Jettenia ecosi]